MYHMNYSADVKRRAILMRVEQMNKRILEKRKGNVIQIDSLASLIKKAAEELSKAA